MSDVDPGETAPGKKSRQRKSSVAEDLLEAQQAENVFRRGEEWFLATATYSDIIITCSGVPFKLHRMILCRESHYFAEKILVQKEDDISVDADEADFKGLCDIIYVDGKGGEDFSTTVVNRMVELKMKPERCLRCCLLAHDLLCTQAISSCRHYFDTFIDTDTAISFLKGAWNVEVLSYFQEKCIEVMVLRFENYLGDDNIGILQPEALCEVMTRAHEREPRPPKQNLFSHVGACNLVHQDVQREVSRTVIKTMMGLMPVVNHENVCDLLMQCCKHGADPELERCIPIFAAHTPDVDREKAMLLPRKVILATLRHEALSDIDHAYALGRDYLLKEAPNMSLLISKMDRMGGVAPIDRNRRPRIGTDEWYATEILDTLYTLKNKIRKRDMEAARTLPSFRVMIICAELFEDYRSDVREKLVRSGCTQVEVVLAHERNPSLEQLLTFHSVLVWSNAEFHDPESLGDILADAVDEGTGCILCPYAINAAESKNRIGGRITKYLPCTLGFIEGGIELTMVKNKAVLAAHPECAEILEGVNVLSGGRESMHMTINQVIGDETCACIASWSNNVPMVAIRLPDNRRLSSVIVWNCRPGSNTVSEHGWTASGDGQRLLFNMLVFATNTPTEAKCIL